MRGRPDGRWPALFRAVGFVGLVLPLLFVVAGCADLAGASVITPVPFPTLQPSPTPLPPPTPAGTSLPSPAPQRPGFIVTPTGEPRPAIVINQILKEHYWLEWPVPGQVLHIYPYGAPWPGGSWVHRGVDISASEGDPVQAVASGVVIEAGNQLVEISGRPSGAYGNHVMLRLDRTFEGWPVYILYAHLSQVLVREGQHVQTGERIGLAGMTGNATGPHVHLEVRIGQNSEAYTRNPVLWLKPRQGTGTLAGRLVDPLGRYIHRHPIRIYQGDRLVEETWTYTSSVVHPDEGWGENFVFWELKPGKYTVKAEVGGETHLWTASVEAGRTTLVTFTTLRVPSAATPTASPGP